MKFVEQNVFLGIILFCIICSCSSENSERNLVDSESVGQDYDLFYSCKNYEEGNVKYSITVDSFYQCSNGIWTAINIIIVGSSSSASNEVISSESKYIVYSSSGKSCSLCVEPIFSEKDVCECKNDVQTSSSSEKSDNFKILCENGDKLLSIKDTSYHQCVDGEWTHLEEAWIIVKDTNLYLNVRQGHLLPDAGFYSPFVLRFPESLYGGDVHCTFDGSAPQNSSKHLAENTYIDHTTTVRCSEYKDSVAVVSNTETYFINEKINMPVFSVSTVPSYVDNYIKAEPCTPNPCYSGIFWEDVEFPAHVEYFDKGSNSEKKDFEIEAGLSIVGGWSRNFLKKSVSITMRDEYQKGRMKFPFFDTRPENNSFKSIKLRNNGNRFISDYICDPMATSLLEGTNVDYQRSRQVVVFFNGDFYGIYDMREKLNEHFIETNYEIPNNQVEIIEQTTSVVKAIHGSAQNYREMLQFVKDNDFTDSSDAYEKIKEVVDIDNFVDYMAAEMYFHNGDWPQNNVRAWRTLNRPWRFIAFDIDHGFDWSKRVSGFKQSTNMLEWVLGGGKPESSCAKGDAKCFVNLFIKLFKNSTFRRLFVNRSVILYSEYVNSENVSETVDRMVASIDPNMISRDLELFPRDSFAYKSSCQVGFDPYGSCLKKWSIDQDSIIREQFRSVLGLGEDIRLKFDVVGSGKIKMEDFDLPKIGYEGVFYGNNPILLTAVASDDSSVFDSWEDGSTDNPRIVLPITDSIFIAKFKKAD